MSDEVLQEIKKKLADAGGLKWWPTAWRAFPPTSRRAQDLRLGQEDGHRGPGDRDHAHAMHDKLCTEYNIRMALHNHPKSWPPEKVLAACKDRCKLIGSCSDTGHWMRANRVPVDTLKMLQGRVMHLHFKDLDQFGGGQDVPWGTGKGDPRE